MSDLNRPERKPTPNGLPAVWDLVVHDMKERDAEGRRKYGTRLQPGNGRKPLIDAYQEALDLVVYLRQEIAEADERGETKERLEDRIAELEEEQARSTHALERVRAERDRLAADALAALSEFVATPVGGYLKEPHCLTGDIQKLGRERKRLEERLSRPLLQLGVDGQIRPVDPNTRTIEVLTEERDSARVMTRQVEAKLREVQAALVAKDADLRTATSRLLELERERQGMLARIAEEEAASANLRELFHAADKKTRAEKDAAYAERNQVVALLARMGPGLSTCSAWVAEHRDEPGQDWDPEWRTVVFIGLPTGQASWHVHDSVKHLLRGVPPGENNWDGHTTEEKYRRVNAAYAVPAKEPHVAP